MEKKLLTVALYELCRKNYWKLIFELTDAESVFKASYNKLAKIASAEDARKIKEFSPEEKWFCSAVKQINKGTKLFLKGDEGYPEEFNLLSNPPPFIFVKGSFTHGRLRVAVVGTRKPTFYGKKVAYDISYEIASMGVPVVSGFARGVDAISHRAALDAGCETIAVIGTGVDLCYPSENSELHGRIVEKGAVISEFLPGTLPFRQNFPLRNRLIAALASGILVIEAGERSGSLITARIGAEINREVFAVPGQITSEVSKGTNMLIKNGGAVPVSSGKELLEFLAPLKFKGVSGKKGGGSDKTEKDELLNILSCNPLHIDEIIVKLPLPRGEIMLKLTELEIKGLIKRVHGGNYIKI